MNCFELFAGCGGLGYGFHNEGFNIVAANELCEKIASTYKHNFPNTNVIVGDITQKDIKQQVYKKFENIDCDVILGGPPVSHILCLGIEILDPGDNYSWTCRLLKI